MGRLTPWKFIIDQFSTIPPVSEFKADLTDKTVVVTGANVGIGLEAARHFASMNPGRLILACRNMQKATEAMESIRKTTGCKSLEFWSLDLASFESISAFGDRFEKEGSGRLDLLVENAGTQSYKFESTDDDWEKTLQVNHLGTSLLAILLLPYLLRNTVSSSTPRIVLVASEVHLTVQSFPGSEGPAILETLNEQRQWSITAAFRRYAVSKLLNVFFTRALAMRLLAPLTGNLTVTCTNPGFCRTELARDVSGIFAWIKFLGEFLLARTAEVGSRNVVWAALWGGQGELHGRYTSRCRIEEESDLVLSKAGSEMEAKLWKETIEILSKADPRVKTIVDEHLIKIEDQNMA